MIKIWKEARKSVIPFLLVLAIGFGAGRSFVSCSSGEAEVVEPIVPAKEKFDLELPAEVEKRIVTVDEIEVALADISQFSTYCGEYTVSKSADYARYFLDNIAIPGTINTITIECSGIVKVGYEVADIEIKVDNDSFKIYISLPEAKVLDNYVIWDTVRCQEENNILNPIDFEQYQGLISEIETEGLTVAEADGIYEDAEANVEIIICNFLSGFEDYEIFFL